MLVQFVTFLKASHKRSQQSPFILYQSDASSEWRLTRVELKHTVSHWLCTLTVSTVHLCMSECVCINECVSVSEVRWVSEWVQMCVSMSSVSMLPKWVCGSVCVHVRQWLSMHLCVRMVECACWMSDYVPLCVYYMCAFAKVRDWAYLCVIVCLSVTVCLGFAQNLYSV